MQSIIGLVALLIAFTSAGPSTEAQVQDAVAIESVIGLWSLEGSDGACRMALQRQAKGGVHGVHVERCTSALGQAAAGWRPTSQGVELLDHAGLVLAVFIPRGVDAFVSIDGRRRLERAFEV